MQMLLDASQTETGLTAHLAEITLPSESVVLSQISSSPQALQSYLHSRPKKFSGQSAQY